MAGRTASRGTGGRTQARRSPKRRSVRRWSRRVTETSDALTLDEGVFKKPPRALALSLKRSAERSRRRKADPYRSAMSMLTFYINRAGRNLGAGDRRRLDQAKDALREVFHRPPGKTAARPRRSAAAKRGR